MVAGELKCSIEDDENLYMVLENPFDIKDVQRIINSLYSKISVIFTCFLVSALGFYVVALNGITEEIVRNQ